MARLWAVRVTLGFDGLWRSFGSRLAILEAKPASARLKLKRFLDLRKNG
jgi:hypothetical protein